MAISKSKRIEVFKKFDGHCAYCGAELKLMKDMQVDHIIPQVLFYGDVKTGGSFVPDFLKHLKEWDVDHIDNLNPACRSCNNWKTFFRLEEFRDEMQKQLERCNKMSRNYRMAKRYGQVQETPKPIVFYFERLLLIP